MKKNISMKRHSDIAIDRLVRAFFAVEDLLDYYTDHEIEKTKKGMEFSEVFTLYKKKHYLDAPRILREGATMSETLRLLQAWRDYEREQERLKGSNWLRDESGE